MTATFTFQDYHSVLVPSTNWRDDKEALGGRESAIYFTYNYFDNPLETFTYEVGPLINAIYNFRITTIDNRMNESDTDTESVEIASWPDQPTNLAASVTDTDEITLTWTATQAGDLDHYNIYYNAGSGYSINYFSVYDTATSVATSKALSGLADGDYRFGIRAVATGGLEEQNTAFVAISLPEGFDVPDLPGAPVNKPQFSPNDSFVTLGLTNVSVGSLQFDWWYFSTCDKFLITTDYGAGIVDDDMPFIVLDKIAGVRQTYISKQLINTEDVTWKYRINAMNTYTEFTDDFSDDGSGLGTGWTVNTDFTRASGLVRSNGGDDISVRSSDPDLSKGLILIRFKHVEAEGGIPRIYAVFRYVASDDYYYVKFRGDTYTLSVGYYDGISDTDADTDTAFADAFDFDTYYILAVLFDSDGTINATIVGTPFNVTASTSATSGNVGIRYYGNANSIVMDYFNCYSDWKLDENTRDFDFIIDGIAPSAASSFIGSAI